MNLQVRQIGLLVVLFGTIVSLSLIWLNPACGRAAHVLRNTLERLARHRVAVAITVASSVLILRIALLPVWGIPVPSVPDEFSHLLVGDTLASGRFANPANPMWEHFETPYELQRPTYASAYPPGQGIFLAAGEVLFGRPWRGVWLSAGLMCLAFCWMFYQWLPPLWAMAAGIWAALQLGLFSYWMNSYWGGAVSAAGGALVIGAVAQLRHGVTARRGAILAAGISILGASRPYEGAVLTAAALGCIGYELLRRRMWPPSPRALLPGLAILLLFAAASLYYCWRVTGHPFELPLFAYAKQYAVTGAFVWQKSPPEPEFRDSVLGAEMKSLAMLEKQYQSLPGALSWTLWKAMRIGGFYLGPLLVLPLAMLPWLLRGRFRSAVLMAAASLTGILLTIFLELHYAAPMSSLFYLLTAQSLRILWTARRFGNSIGRFLVPSAPAVALITMVLTASPPTARTAHIERARIVENLRRTPDLHLVIVRYGSPHQLADEWVFNDADLDRSPVVWARDKGPLNEELVRYFHNRKAWYLDADRSPPSLTPYRDDAAAPGQRSPK